MIKRILKFLWHLTVTVGILGLTAFLFPRLITFMFSLNRIFHTETAPAERLAIVFGAVLRWD